MLLTAEGLLYKAFNNNEVIKLDLSDGLSSNIINKIYLEDDSTILVWLTNNGLNKVILDLTQPMFQNIKSIKKITTLDGLLSNYIYDVIKFNENIWVATQMGVNYFNQSTVKISSHAPAIIIDSVIVSSKNIFENSHVNLNYDENDLTFHYTGISHKKPKNGNFYNYAIVKDNSDTLWNATNNRSIQLH